MNIEQLVIDANKTLDEMMMLLSENKIEEFANLVDKFKFLSLGIFDAKNLTKNEASQIQSILTKIDQLSQCIENKKSTINDEFTLLKKTQQANSTYMKYS
jgi:hypothetical protein